MKKVLYFPHYSKRFRIINNNHLIPTRYVKKGWNVFFGAIRRMRLIGFFLICSNQIPSLIMTLLYLVFQKIKLLLLLFIITKYQSFSELSDAAIMELNLPTGIPFVYELDENMKPTDSMVFLGDEETVKKAMAAVAAQGKAK